MKKYKTAGTWQPEIEVVEVIKETEKSVWIYCYRYGRDDEPERRNKVTDYEVYHDSWGEARSHLVSKAKNKLRIAENQVENERSYLEKIELLPLRESDEG